jgi:hypothetical protein
MQNHFITFGDGTRQHRGAARRLARQATRSGVFASAVAYDWLTLGEQFPEFTTAYDHLRRKHRRGFGFWVWKGFMIGERLKALPEGDCLLYADAGCEFVLPTRADYRAWLADAQTGDLTALVLENHATGRVWTNRYMREELPWAEEFIDRPQIATTFMNFRNVAAIRNLVADWAEMCARDDAALMIDRTLVDEDPVYQEHRHDQSLFSLLAYRAAARGDFTMKLWTCEGSAHPSFPLQGIRNKTSVSKFGKPHFIYKVCVKLANAVQSLGEKVTGQKRWSRAGFERAA